MSEEQNVQEIRRIVNLLEKTHRIAREASISGALSGGREYVVRQYNAIVANLGERGLVLPAYFPTLGEGGAEVTFDEVGIACAQLADYLRADLPEEERGRHGKGHGPHGSFSVNVGNLPELKNIGEVIRESLPHWMRAAREGSKEVTTESSGNPTAAHPQGPPSDLGGLRDQSALNDLESRLAEVGAKIQVVAEQMRREELPAAELQRLANELSRLGREQAQMAQEAAARRTLGGTPS
jgi:hypothetical protein